MKKFQQLYEGYIDSTYNQNLIKKILELDVVQNENELRIVLANFSVQLYYQRHNILYSNNDVLLNFITEHSEDDFCVLIKDLVGGQLLDASIIKKIQPVLNEKVVFVPGEDTLGFMYLSLQSFEKRKSLGVYYTPKKSVEELIKNLYEDEPDIKSKTIYDPCCGSGIFLLSLVRRGIPCSLLWGQDIDPISVCLARINLALMQTEFSVSDICSRISIGNTYFENPVQKFDIILGNPPWGSKLSEDDTIKCRSLFKTATKKNMESYDLFVEKSLLMLKDNGVLAFILPESVLNVSTHKITRDIIISSCSFQFIVYLGDVFPNVQCPSIILGIKLNCKKNIIGCKVQTQKEQFTILKPRIFTNDILSLNISDEEYECLDSISNTPGTVYLKGNAKFALGIVTGNNKRFLSDRKDDNNEIVLKGCDLEKYRINQPQNYIQFKPESFQQVAPLEMYRAEEKLLYRFISKIPVFAYDDQQTLSLNSCNILIPKIEGLEIKYILAILNSSVATYFMSKKFNSVKLLRSHIEQMPIPFVSAEIQRNIIEKVDIIMNHPDKAKEIYWELEKDVLGLFDLTDEQSEKIISFASTMY